MSFLCELYKYVWSGPISDLTRVNIVYNEYDKFKSINFTLRSQRCWNRHFIVFALLFLFTPEIFSGVFKKCQKNFKK